MLGNTPITNLPNRLQFHVMIADMLRKGVVDVVVTAECFEFVVFGAPHASTQMLGA